MISGNNGEQISAYIAKPLGNGPFPGVVLVHHIPGWDEWYFETTRRLTHHGYATICPNLFHRAGEGKSDDIAAKAGAFQQKFSRRASNFIDNLETVIYVDVNEKNLATAAAAHPQARREVDFRKLFDRPEAFDAVVVSTCEHTHALATMLALKARKHVYCEKPLTHNVHEARLVRETAAKAGVVTQMGIQIHATENYRRVVELIRKVAANRTVLMVEHNMKVVSSIADTITVLQRGSVIASGTYAEVSTNPQVMDAYLGTATPEGLGAH